LREGVLFGFSLLGKRHKTHSGLPIGDKN